MFFRKKYIRAVLFSLLPLLLLGGVCLTVSGTAPAVHSGGDLTLIAGFTREDGIAFDCYMVHVSSGGLDADYPLGRSGDLLVMGLPRSGDLLMTVLDRQGRSVGAMTLSFSEGAVIDAATVKNGAGHITLRRDTDILPLLFSLSEDGSLQCVLWRIHNYGAGLPLWKETKEVTPCGS